MDRLTAQRYLYRRVKRVENLRLILIVLTVSLVILDFRVDSVSFTHVVTLIVLFSWFLEQAVLESWVSHLKNEAAAIQEDFDRTVLEIPWPVHRGAESPTEDRINELTRKAARTAKVTDMLTDWYPPDAIPADPIRARLHCQRTNCRWDSRLRKEWIWSACIFLVAILVFGLGWAALVGVTVIESVMVAAAGLRVLAWLVAEFTGQFAARNRVRRLHRYLSVQEQTGHMTMCDVRLVQDAIFEHRRTCPTVPDWFYRIRRSGHERLERVP